MIINTILGKLQKDKKLTVSASLGYYEEIITLRKIDDETLEVQTTVDTWNKYEDGTSTFVETITIPEFVQFLQNRLSAENTAIMNGKQIKMDEYLQAFTNALHVQSLEKVLDNHKELAEALIEKIKPKITSDEIDWNCENASELFDEILDKKEAIQTIEKKLKAAEGTIFPRDFNEHITDMFDGAYSSHIFKRVVKQHLN